MDNEKLAAEFEFLFNRLKKIAGLMCTGNSSDIIEASFMIGCLHSICHQHYTDFSKKQGKTDG